MLRRPNILWLPAVGFVLLLVLWAGASGLENPQSRILAINPDLDDLAGSGWQGHVWRYWWTRTLAQAWTIEHHLGWAGLPLAFFIIGHHVGYGNPLDLWAMALLDPWFGLSASYNLVILLFLFLNGLAGMMLCRHLTGSRAGAMIGALILAVNPYVLQMAALGRLRETLIAGIPLYILGLVRLREGAGRIWVLLTGLFLGLSLVTFWFYGIFCLFFTIVFIFWHLMIGEGGKREPPGRRNRISWSGGFWIALGAALAIGVILALPGGIILTLTSSGVSGLPETSWFTPFPPLENIISPDYHPPPQVQAPGSPGGGTFYNPRRTLSDSHFLDDLINCGRPWNISLFVLLLALVPAFFQLRRAGLWLLGFISFLVLGLGPYLKLTQKAGFALAPHGIPLPYKFLYQFLPFFSRLAHPNRADAVLYTCIAALAAINLVWLFRHFNLDAGQRNLLTALIIIACLGQLVLLGPFPLPTAEFAPAPFYRELAQAPPGGIIELPLMENTNAIQFEQIFHRRPIYRGWSPGVQMAGKAPELARFQELRVEPNNSFGRFLDRFRVAEGSFPAVLSPDMAFFVNNGYGYVVLHEKFCYRMDPKNGGAIHEEFARALTTLLGPPLVQGTDSGLKEYRVLLFGLPAPR